jgi:hypothetical protein
MRRDQNGGPPFGKIFCEPAEPVLEATVHPPGRLVERDQAGQCSALHLAGERDRQGEPLALASREVAGVGVGRDIEADRFQGGFGLGTGKFIPHPLPDQVVAGVLAEQRDPAGCGDLSLDRVHESGGGAQESRLAGTVPAHQGDGLPPIDRQVDATQYVDRAFTRVQLDPEAADRQGVAPGVGAGLGRSGPNCSPLWRSSPVKPWPSRIVLASLTPTGIGSMPARENMRAAGVAKAASFSVA